MTCNDCILEIFNNKKLNELISNIEPSDLQDDLKQELIVALYDYGCDKIMELHSESKLIGLAMKICWYMGTGNKNKFYKTFRKNNSKSAYEYLLYVQGKDNSDKSIKIAESILKNKMNVNANEAHEAIIFKKYVEYGNCIQVAKFFNIPQLHVYSVVNKVKNELKTKINDN